MPRAVFERGDSAGSALVPKRGSTKATIDGDGTDDRADDPRQSMFGGVDFIPSQSVEPRRSVQEDVKKTRFRLCKLCVRVTLKYVCESIGCYSKKALKLNSWVKFEDREKRLEIISKKLHFLTTQRMNFMEVEGHGRVKKLFTFFMWRLQAYHISIRESFGGMCGRRDHRTGLPRSFLANWRLEKLHQEGAHGRFYIGSPMKEYGKKSAEKVAIRIRDKSLGSVVFVFWGRSNLKRIASEVTELRHFSCKRRALRLLRLVDEPFYHGCLVNHYDFYTCREWFVEVFEYLGGGNLADYLAKRQAPFNEYDTCRVVARLIDALQYLHSRKLMHRDIRMNQIILPEAYPNIDGAKLGDFWMLTRIPKKGFVIDGIRPADLTYVPPEVVKSGWWSDKSDMWSAACVMFEMLQGYPPFGGKGSALLKRIAAQKPEYDKHLKLSVSTSNLLSQLFRRKPEDRLSAQDALRNKWFHRFKGSLPIERERRVPQRIKEVRLIGKLPRHRGAMHPENLISAKPGSFTKGYCTFMGSTSCSFDFEILGNDDQEFWVTHVELALWGSPENPRKLLLQIASRADTTFQDLARHEVESQYETEARLQVGRPMKFARLSAEQNHGGSIGIAIKKVLFYGYEIRSVPVRLDVNCVEFTRGSCTHLHTETIEPENMHEIVHPNLLNDLHMGKRVPGTQDIYRKLVSVSSGPPHRSTAIITAPIQIDDDKTIISASLALRYYSNTPPTSSGPVVTCFILFCEEVEELEEEEEHRGGLRRANAKTKQFNHARRPSISQASEGSGSPRGAPSERKSVLQTAAKPAARKSLSGRRPSLADAGAHQGEDIPAKAQRIEAEYRTISRQVLCFTEMLPATPWSLDDILENGYADYSLIDCGELDITTDKPLKVEVQFVNNAGTLFVPEDFGLRFYYVPKLASPPSGKEGDSDSGSDISATSRDEGGFEQFMSARKAKKLALLKEQQIQEKKAASAKQKADQAAAALESELEAIQTELQHATVYGKVGISDARDDEIDGWHPTVLVDSYGPDGEPITSSKDNWWDKQDQKAQDEMLEKMIAGIEGREEEWVNTWTSSAEEMAHREAANRRALRGGNSESSVESGAGWEPGESHESWDKEGEGPEDGAEPQEEEDPSFARMFPGGDQPQGRGRKAISGKAYTHFIATEKVKEFEEEDERQAKQRRSMRLEMIAAMHLHEEMRHMQHQPSATGQPAASGQPDADHRRVAQVGFSTQPSIKKQMSGLPSTFCGVDMDEACGGAPAECSARLARNDTARRMLSSFTPAAPPSSPRQDQV